MRRRLRPHGYLYIKGLLPPEDVLKTRAYYFSQYSGTGLLKPGNVAVDGIYNSGRCQSS